MMEYDLFKKLVSGRIMDYMPPIFHDHTPSLDQVPKVNGTREAFCLMPPGNNTNIAIPTLYMEDLYEQFTEDEDLDEILRFAAGVFMRWSGMEMPELAEFRLEEHTDSIIVNLISTDRNEALLQNVPHIDFLGMSVIYRVIHSMDENGINSAIVTNDMMKMAGMTPEDLQEHGRNNMREMFPFKTLDDTGSDIIVVTNEPGYFGASSMLYGQDMQRLAEQMGGDFFIMPTSIHEFFAIPTDTADPEKLIRMLACGNDTVTRPEEQLSNAIYRYLADEELIVRVASYSTGERR